MSDPRPIGVFDSGVGGLTVLREILRRLTLTAAATRPDAILWPETALVDGPTWDPDSRRWLLDLVHDAGVPILFGTVDAERPESGKPARYFNAAMMVRPRES